MDEMTDEEMIALYAFFMDHLNEYDIKEDANQLAIRFSRENLPTKFEIFRGGTDEAFRILIKSYPYLIVPGQAKLACHLISALVPFLDIDGETFYQILRRVEPNLALEENTQELETRCTSLAEIGAVKFQEGEKENKKLYDKLVMWSEGLLQLHSLVDEKKKKQALSRSIVLISLILMRATMKPARKVASLLSSAKNKVTKVSQGLFYPLHNFNKDEVQMMSEAMKSSEYVQPENCTFIFLTIRCGIAAMENLDEESLPRKIIQFGLMDYLAYYSLTLPNIVEQAASVLKIPLDRFLNILLEYVSTSSTSEMLKRFWGSYLESPSSNAAAKYFKIFPGQACQCLAVKRNIPTVRMCQWIVDKHSKGPTSKHPVWKLQFVDKVSDHEEEVAKAIADHLKKIFLDM